MFKLKGVEFNVRPNGTHSYYYKVPATSTVQLHKEEICVYLVDDPSLKGNYRKISEEREYDNPEYDRYEDSAHYHHTLTVDTRRNRLIYTIKEPKVVIRKHRKEGQPPYVIRHIVKVFWIQLDPIMVKYKETGQGWRTVEIDSFINTNLMRSAFYPILVYIFGSTNILRAVAPNIPAYTRLPYWSRPLWNGSITKEAKKLFGWNNSTVIKAINEGMDLNILRNLKIFDGIVGFDIAWLCIGYAIPSLKDKSQRVQKKFFKQLPLKFLMALKDKKPSSYTVRDAIRMYLELPEEKRTIDFTNIRNWTELHDHINRLRKRSSKMVYDYSNQPALLELDGQQINGYTIKIPHSTEDVEDWGDDQHHCIGSYAREHLKNSILFAMYQQEQLKYCVMLDLSYEVRQFYGKYNSEPETSAQFVLGNILLYLTITKK